MAIEEVAGKDPACTGNGGIEVGQHPSSLPPSPALKRVRFP